MTRFTVALSCLTFAVACNSGSGTPTLTSLTSVTSDSKCPTGGVVITAGADKNGNGKLDSSEVTQTQEVCNGANGQPGMNGMNGNGGPSGDAGTNGAASLVDTTQLPAGDPHCPEGGEQLDFGLDNGANGGTANDGILQSGEILQTSYVCNGTVPYYADSVTPPAAPAGQYSIVTKGGDGVSGGGGRAGQVSIYLNPGSLGGGVKVFNTGSVDAGFTLPTPPAFVAGSNPLAVTATDLVIHPYADNDAGIGSNDVYFYSDYDSAVFKNVGGTAVLVTSVSVAAGRTLTLEVDTQQPSAYLSVPNDIHNAGTLKTGTVADGVSGASLYLSASNFYGDTGSSIVTKGLDGTVSTDGGMNGPAGYGGAVGIEVGALLVNQGSIDTSGGSGEGGAQGGAISLMSEYAATYNTGALKSVGGTGTNNNGGLGGQIQLQALRGVYNSGACTATGGDGASGGGNSQGISLNTSGGTVKNSGALTASGGACTTGECSGGGGGDINLIAAGGDLFNDAALTTIGGQSDASGGNGGNITIECAEAYPQLETNVRLAAGSVHLDGNINTTGGKGSPAGTGGYVDIYSDPQNVPLGQKVELFGYTTIDASGGVGDNATGGNGWYINIFNTPSFPSYGESNSGAASGPVVNYAKVSATGGDGTLGGSPGNVSITTQQQYDFRQPLEQALNFGDIDVSAGASSNYSGGIGGGSVVIDGISGVENHGTLKARGGSISGGPSSAGYGGNVDVTSESGPGKNTGAIDVSGGGGSGNAGGGGGIYLYATLFDNSGNLTANGGNGTVNGGNGGEVNILSSQGTSTNSGTFSVSAGTGTPPGNKGYVSIDGVDVTP